jgi:hypothetical protein
MENEAFVKEAYEEIDEMDRQTLERNEKIKLMIAAKNDAYATFTFIGQQIRYRPLIGKRLRHKMATAKNSLSSDDAEEGLKVTERIIYEILGELCIDEPFNTWQAWAYLDEKAEGVGGVQPVFRSLMQEITKSN